MSVEVAEFKVLQGATVTAPLGFIASGLHAGIKRKRKDVGVLYSEVPATAAGVFTTNRVRAACVVQNEIRLRQQQQLQAIVVSSGNANACNGVRGLADDLEVRRLAALRLAVPEDQVALAMTGVIGMPMPMEPLTAGVEQAIKRLSREAGADFAESMLTRDATTKTMALTFTIDGCEVTIGTAAKGSGMVHPNMATMLAFITTDAAVEAESLQQLLSETTERTFNRITVDGDTSTNDMVLVMANGLAGNQRLSHAHPQWATFESAFQYVAEHLSKQIARDGEGATKLVEVIVRGAENESAAGQMAKAVVGSSLVKTAMHGGNADWGRILVAAGCSGVTLDAKKTDLWIGPIQVAAKGAGVEFDLSELVNYLQGDDVQILLDLHLGTGESIAYGCDLSYEYVRVNANYRTRTK